MQIIIDIDIPAIGGYRCINVHILPIEPTASAHIDSMNQVIFHTQYLFVSTHRFKCHLNVSTTVKVKATYPGCVFCTISHCCHTIDGLIKMCQAEMCHIF